MTDLVVQVGSCSIQGKRSNNEDAFFANAQESVFLVADGMGGQDQGERASGLAAQIIPEVVRNSLAAHIKPDTVVKLALNEAHHAIVQAGKGQHTRRRMGTTAVLAVQQDDKIWVAGVGDSPAYLIRGGKVEQLTIDHTVADALARNGTLTLDQAKSSPLRNSLYKFLGCQDMTEDPDVLVITPQAGDWLVLASDGLSGHINAEDLRSGAARYTDPQAWANDLVQMALERGSNDNITCVLVTFT